MDKKRIESLISDDRIGEAIDALKSVFRGASTYNEVILISNKYEAYKQKILRGTESNEELNRTKNRITEALLIIAERIPKTGFYPSESGLFNWSVDITRREKERAQLLKKEIIDKAGYFSFSDNTLKAISIVYNELIANAFQHGCDSNQDTVVVKVEVSSEYVSLTVVNPNIIDFDLGKKIDESIEQIERNPAQKRGRGLLYVFELSDEFYLVGRKALKTVFYKDHCDFLIKEIDDRLLLIDVVSGLENPAFSRNLAYYVNHLIDEKFSEIILSFRRFTQRWNSTIVITITIELSEMLNRQNKKFVAILRRDKEVLSKVDLPNVITTYTWEGALSKVGRADALEMLGSRLKEIIGQDGKFRYLSDG